MPGIHERVCDRRSFSLWVVSVLLMEIRRLKSAEKGFPKIRLVEASTLNISRGVVGTFFFFFAQLFSFWRNGFIGVLFGVPRIEHRSNCYSVFRVLHLCVNFGFRHTIYTQTYEINRNRQKQNQIIFLIFALKYSNLQQKIKKDKNR